MMSRPSDDDWGRNPDRKRVPHGCRVYAVGDCHGRADLLGQLHEIILEDSRSAEQARKVVVYLGDYVDRGPASRQVVELLINNPLPGFSSTHLLGNHEDFMLQFLENPDGGMLWLMNGGDATLRSYGVDPAAPPQGQVDRFTWLQQELLRRLPAEHLGFLRSLKLTHAEGDYLFVHAGVRPDTALDQQDPHDLVWIREPFLSSSRDYGKIVVHGHTPNWEPVVRRNRIGIDTGACYGGSLTALVLEDDRRRLIHAS